MPSGVATAVIAVLGVLALYAGIKVVAFLFKVFFLLVGIALLMGAIWWGFTPH